MTAAHPTDDRLIAYGLGKMDDTAAEEVLNHLEGCETCKRRVAELSADSFVDRLREGHEAKTPGSGYTGVSAAVRATPWADDKAVPPELLTLKQYADLRELGRGGMGVVYVAHNTDMDRPEVLKVVQRSSLERVGTGAVERFLREIQAAAPAPAQERRRRLHRPPAGRPAGVCDGVRPGPGLGQGGAGQGAVGGAGGLLLRPRSRPRPPARPRGQDGPPGHQAGQPDPHPGERQAGGQGAGLWASQGDDRGQGERRPDRRRQDDGDAGLHGPGAGAGRGPGGHPGGRVLARLHAVLPAGGGARRSRGRVAARRCCEQHQLRTDATRLNSRPAGRCRPSWRRWWPK